jgi:hypothetical protein
MFEQHLRKPTPSRAATAAAATADSDGSILLIAQSIGRTAGKPSWRTGRRIAAWCSLGT